jgi:hypothetical protein
MGTVKVAIPVEKTGRYEGYQLGIVFHFIVYFDFVAP